MTLPFDPSDLSVNKAAAKLDGLSGEELDALRDAELEGKNRITLITAIDVAASDLMESETAEEPPAPEPVAVSDAPPTEAGYFAPATCSWSFTGK